MNRILILLLFVFTVAMPQKTAASFIEYEVLHGDTISSISRTFGVSPYHIQDENPLILVDMNVIKEGQILKFQRGIQDDVRVWLYVLSFDDKKNRSLVQTFYGEQFFVYYTRNLAHVFKEKQYEDSNIVTAAIQKNKRNDTWIVSSVSPNYY